MNINRLILSTRATVAATSSSVGGRSASITRMGKWAFAAVPSHFQSTTRTPASTRSFSSATFFTQPPLHTLPLSTQAGAADINLNTSFRAYKTSRVKRRTLRKTGSGLEANARLRRATAPAGSKPTPAKLPKFSSLMKKFQFLVHPDFFEQNKSMQETNMDSFQRLNEFFSTIKNREFKVGGCSACVNSGLSDVELFCLSLPCLGYNAVRA